MVQIKSADIHPLSVGIDIGSTTAKVVLLDENNKIKYERYERHFSQIKNKVIEILKDMGKLVKGKSFSIAISGSAGLGLAQTLNIPFVQEVYATGEVVKLLEPETGTVIELGGEDAKIIFLSGGIDERMNGSCAGGTGAFIDQMATLLNVSVDEMDRLSQNYSKLYPIASRCGVFAKTDIQPLLNQGARKEDICASIYQAVVNQTIAGLAHGRKIKSKVMFLGGPLYYCKGLRDRFTDTLKLTDETALCPEYARFAVALGAAFYAEKTGKAVEYEDLMRNINTVSLVKQGASLPPLFKNREEYDEFITRHEKATVNKVDISKYSGRAYLGIDCGSTTTKLLLISDNMEILYSYYSSNKGNPVEIVREQLVKIYDLCADRIKICGSAVTGYGEELIKSAFGIDIGVVETIAHYTAAKFFRPDVDFILDIGGQDIKCFKIRGGAIDSIMLNEACSSGCGSFIETFARSLGSEIEEFSRKGLASKAPVNLGSRCTVFMNSSVKQSQKDGATIGDISAGLSISIVKNAVYKVIRAGSPDELGKNIVVQGGTFLNNAVLRAFEIELGGNVIRPTIAGLMGAYGAALQSMRITNSAILKKEELENFIHNSKLTVCKGCTNHCRITINTFSDGNKYVSGNQCEKGLGIKKAADPLPNLYEFKRNKLFSLKRSPQAKRGKLGLPMALGMYELAPLWHGIFNELGFDVVLSGPSSRRIYEKGYFSIPSDTACYPAKIMHGHIEELIEQGVEAIFYPCLSYNVDEGIGDNHYNCPVVAYYSELLNGNMENLGKVKFLYPYLNVNNRKELTRELYKYLRKFYSISALEIKKAVKAGFDEYESYMNEVRTEGEKALEYARTHNKRIMILAGRPYHIDPEIGHGIDKLALSLDFVVVSEDSVCHLADPQPVHVLNQWTYHSRLYRAARYAAEHSDTQLVQLVSFGCGVDAITTDEVREILESSNKFYTQIKIDEITNLGAVKIRLRSLIGAMEERGEI
ncbi:MAG: acyl-CoA dehydratase activase [Bacillota bacterium]|nr:acyl-CoA dehydratase activase [Bacillota bacterium]